MKRAIAAVPERDWQGPARLGVLQVAEVKLRLPDWSCSRRVVVGRRCLGRISKEVAGTFWDEAEARIRGLCDEPADRASQRLANHRTVSPAGGHRERVRRTQTPMGAGRLLLPPTQRDGVGGTAGLVDLQPVAFVSAPAGTGAARGERGRAAVVSADCRTAWCKAGGKRRSKSVSAASGGTNCGPATSGFARGWPQLRRS